MVDGGSTLGSSRRPGLLLSSFWESFWVRKDMICDVLLATQGGRDRERERKKEKEREKGRSLSSCLLLSSSVSLDSD